MRRLNWAWLAVIMAGCGMIYSGNLLLPASQETEPTALNLTSAAMLDGSQDEPDPGSLPAPAGRSGEWLMVSNHVHSTFSSDAKQSLAQLIERARVAGLNSLILTDHNTMQGADTPEFKQAPLVMVKGIEWGARRDHGERVVGHAGLIELAGNAPLPTNVSIDQMVDLALRRKGFIIANHPFLRGISWAATDLHPAVGAIEVWNSWWALVDPLTRNNRAKDWWEHYLATGRRVTALGGSDSHGHVYDSPTRPVNLVFATKRTAGAILEAISAGRVTVEATTRAARIMLEADPQNAGSWSVMQGEELTVAKAGPVPVRARIKGGKDLTVEFYGKSGLLKAYRVASDDATIRFEMPVQPGDGDYVRAELKARPNHWWSLTALTNPIYLR
ncbi:MAG: PHP domain-containing protein [Cyanobacteria bacterium NC_groundwater_1444_Ag_S-0.65um_54_12]|nr:PHP domain-containing protein [Cyanobacteria bacterium NC_groundwater_1444_Ag_S-0.65um_54_12]